MDSKKWIALVLTGALVVGMSACSSGDADDLDETEKQPTAEEVIEELPTQTQQAEIQQVSMEVENADEVDTAEEVEGVDTVKETEGTGDIEPAVEEIDLFTDTNETVYATGTVNLRSGSGTQYEKVGSLSWADAVTRIGIGTGEADGWSEVELEAGSGEVVYVASSYLSTTKPVASQPSSSSSSSGSTQQSAPSTTPAPSTPAPSTGSSSSNKSSEQVMADMWAALEADPSAQAGRKAEEEFNSRPIDPSNYETLTPEDIDYLKEALGGSISG